MGFLSDLKMVFSMQDEEDVKFRPRKMNSVVLIQCADYINAEDWGFIADLVRKNKILILDMDGVGDYDEAAARAFEFICGAVKSYGGWMYPMGGGFHIVVPNRRKYSVLTKQPENYDPYNRERGDKFLVIR